MTDHVVIGITGNIACGKSTVDAMLQDLGAGYIVDADRVVHDLLASDVDVQQAVAARFGPQVLSTAGIDRRALGALVFADPRALHDLEEILHPRVRLQYHRAIGGPAGGNHRRGGCCQVAAGLIGQCMHQPLVDHGASGPATGPLDRAPGLESRRGSPADCRWPSPG